MGEIIKWLLKNSSKTNDTYYFYSESANITYTSKYNKVFGTIETKNQQINYDFFLEDLIQGRDINSSRVRFSDRYEIWFGKGSDLIYYLEVIKWLLETNPKSMAVCCSSYNFLGWLPQYKEASLEKGTYIYPYPYPWMEKLEIGISPIKNDIWEFSAKAYKWGQVFASLTLNFTMKDICFKIRNIVYDWLKEVEECETRNSTRFSIK